MHSHGIRFGCPNDLGYIVDCWAKETLQRDQTWRDGKEFVRSILRRPGIIVRVAHVPDDEDAILGWVCLEPPAGPLEACVHFAYVRNTARKLGIFKSLVADLLDKKVQYTHRPRVPIHLPGQWSFHPERTFTMRDIHEAR